MQVGNAEGHRGHSENSETKHRQRPILHNHILHDRTALLPSIGSETDREICTSCPVHQLSLVGTKNSIGCAHGEQLKRKPGQVAWARTFSLTASSLRAAAGAGARRPGRRRRRPRSAAALRRARRRGRWARRPGTARMGDGSPTTTTIKNGQRQHQRRGQGAAARWAGKAVGGGPLPRRAGDGDERARRRRSSVAARGRWGGVN